MVSRRGRPHLPPAGRPPEPAAEAPAARRHQAARRAAAETVVAVVVSLIVLLVVGVTDARYWGEDVSQRLLAAVRPGGALGVRGAADAQQEWALVDLGPEICRTVVGGGRCPPDAVRTDPSGVMQALRWVLAAEPRVVVIDVAVGMTEDERKQLDTIAEKENPAAAAVLAALPGRVSSWSVNADAPVVSLTDAQLAQAEHPGPVHYFPSFIMAGRPTSRSLLPSVDLLTSKGGAPYPTLAMAGAQALRAERAPLVFGKRQPQTCRVMLGSTCADAFRQAERQFSFRPLRVADEQDWAEDHVNGRRFHFASIAAPEALGTKPSPILNGAVVVIGDTRAATLDRHWTALGAVSGAEILLNDLRQFAQGAPERPSLAHEVAEEAPFLAAGALAVFVTALAAGRRRSAGAAKERPVRRLRNAAGQALATALLTVILFVVVLWSVHPSGSPVDIVTPFAGILLEKALECAHLAIGASKRHADRWLHVEDWSR